MEVEVNGEVPERGTIEIIDGKLGYIEVIYNNQMLVKYDSNEILYEMSIPVRCFKYTETDTITITGYTCGEEYKDVIIPSMINDKEVISIGETAFLGIDPGDANKPIESVNINSVIIPDTITEIGYASFAWNQLTSVIIKGKNTTIGYSAFQGNQLRNLIIKNGVTSIGEYAFQYNNLENIILPESVETIHQHAFEYNNINKVVIGSGIKSIGAEAFAKDEGDNPINGIYYGPNKITSVYIDINTPTGSEDSIGIGDKTFGWQEGYSNSNIRWKDSQ